MALALPFRETVTTSLPNYARPSLERAQDDPASREFRRRLRLYEELTIRGLVALVIVAFQIGFPIEPAVVARRVSMIAPVGLFLHGPYFLAAQRGRAYRAQTSALLHVDSLLLSVGHYP